MSIPTLSAGPRRIGIAELERRLGVDRTTIWRWYRAGRFPEPHYIGERRAWFVGEIEAFEARRMAEQVVRRRGDRNLRGRDPAGVVTPGCDPAPAKRANLPGGLA